MQQGGFTVPLLKKLRGKKVITTIHDLHPFFVSKEKTSSLLRKAIEIAATESDFIIADSLQTKSDILDRFDVPERRLEVVPLGVDGRFRPSRTSSAGAKDTFTVGYIGRFSEQKDVPFLLRAFSIFEKKTKKEARLVLYGKGPQYDECVALAKKLGIQNVEFKGFAEESRLVQIYNSFDVFVFPSKREGFGFPILEAQMCSVPVIVKKNARISEEITRFCLKAEDEEHMAALLEETMSRGNPFSEEHKNHLKQFNWENCIDKTIAVYERCLSS